MKKLILFLVLIVLLLGACSSRQLVSSIDLTDIGPKSYDELSSALDVVITPGVQPKSELYSSSQVDMVQVSALTTEKTAYSEDDETQVRVFTAQLQTTQVQIPQQPQVEETVNEALEEVAQQNMAEAEQVQLSAEATYGEIVNGNNGGKGSDFYAFSYSSTQTVTRLDTVVFSVVSYTSGYSGEDHSTSTQSAANFDLTTGERLSLGDVLLPQCREDVYNKITKWLESRTEDYNLFPMDQCLPVVAKKFSPEQMEAQYADWYLTDGGLTLFFNPYEISPNSSGIIKLELSYQEISSKLKQQYQPVLVSDQDLGSFTVYYNTSPDATASTQETISLASGADRLIIWGAEPIYDVSLSRVSWIGGQSVDIGTLYCANYLTADNMLIIELDGAYSLSTLCLRLNPGDGDERTIYFEPELKPGAYAYNFTGNGN